MNNKLFFAIGLAATLLQAPVTVSAQSSGTSQQNPLLMKSNLPFGAPDFSRIKESDYLPAIEAAIKIKRDNIQKIVDNKKKPTFQNTILAFEESGILLDRVCSVFFALTNADKTPVLAEAEDKVMPLLTGLENEISFNQQLFERIKFVYDNEYAKLKGEDQRLTEEIYKSFVRSGALLSAEKMARMKEINSRISELQQQWGNLLPEATNHAVVWVDNREDLAGLSEADIAQCKKDAEMRGGKAPYCIVIINTTQQPILASLQNRALRRKVFEASIHRADGTNPQYNTFPIVTELARLRAEKGQLMGYANYADYSLENTMAKNSANVDNFLEQLIKEYAPKADAETKAIEEYARKTEGSDFQLQPYDRFYYSAKMKKEMLNISDDEVKPYFNVDSVQVNGVFYAANRVYGLTFKERKDIPSYHPDTKVFEVIDRTESPWPSSTATSSAVPRSVVARGWMPLPSRAASANNFLWSITCATAPRLPMVSPRSSPGTRCARCSMSLATPSTRYSPTASTTPSLARPRPATSSRCPLSSTSPLPAFLRSSTISPAIL